MMTVKALATVLLAFPLAACAGTGLTSYEEDEIPACFVDQGAWAGAPQTTRYAEDSFHDLDRHLGRFIDALEQGAGTAADKPHTEWAAQFEPLHIDTGANIARLGRLLPRMESAADLAPMRSQMESGRIERPGGDHHTEYLRVAIAEEIIYFQNASEHMAQFLAMLSEAEARLLDLKSGNASPEAPAQLHEIALALADDRHAASFGFRQVIFDRPNMPVGESLGERLQARVATICQSYSTCGGEEDGCEGGGHSDGLGRAR